MQNIIELPNLSFCIDWVTVSLPFEADKEKIIELCKALNWDWTQLSVGRGGTNGYLYKNTIGYISLLYGTPKGATSMGTCIVLSGKACRQLESLGFNWVEFLSDLLSLGAKFTRLDLAIDDYYGFLNISTMKHYIDNKFVTSRFNRTNYNEQMDTNGNKTAEMLSLGSRTSNIYIRFYDKKLEQKISNDSISVWNRYEIELKKDQANTAANILINNEEDGITLVRKLLANYINFKDLNSTGKNKTRWKNAEWWDDFLDNCKGLSLAKPLEETTLLQKIIWVKNAMSSTLKMLTIALDNKGLVLQFVDDSITLTELNIKNAKLAIESTPRDKHEVIAFINDLHQTVKNEGLGENYER